MNIGSLTLRIAIRGSFSLKDKRRVVKSLKDRLRARFNIAVAEVGDLDHRQAATLGIVSVGNDSGYVLGLLEQAAGFAKAHPEAEVIECSIEML